MARIGDSPDEQRIREMNEQAFRQKVDAEKKVRSDQQRVAFNEVMRQTTQSKDAQTRSKKGAEKAVAERDGEQQRSGAQLRRAVPRDQREAARRAALAKATTGGLGRAREKATAETKGNEQLRSTALEVGGREERERIDKDVRKEELHEAQREAEGTGELGRADATEPDSLSLDPRQRRAEGGGAGSDDGRGNDGIAAAQATRGAGGAAKLPEAVVESLAKAVAIAAAREGGAEVVVSLQGAMFEGVTLRVSAKKGKVRCTFQGCDKQTKNLIESSRGDLMRALSKRGLELDILRVR